MECSGFKVIQGGFKQELIERMPVVDDFAAAYVARAYKVISPEADYQMVALVSDNLELMQFHIAYIDGTVQPMN